MLRAATAAAALASAAPSAAGSPTVGAATFNGLTLRLSQSAGGVEGNGYSSAPPLSGEGGLATFFSRWDNLVPADANGAVKAVFARDAVTGRMVVASVDSRGRRCLCTSRLSSVSANGRHIAVNSDDHGRGSFVPEDAKRDGQSPPRVSLASTIRA